MGSLYRKGTPVVPRFGVETKEHLRLLSDAVNNALAGKVNNINSLSLRKDAVSTTISDKFAGPDSYVDLMPSSPNGGIALGTWHIGTRTSGSFVISHISTSTSDCTAVYVIFG